MDRSETVYTLLHIGHHIAPRQGHGIQIDPASEDVAPATEVKSIQPIKPMILTNNYYGCRFMI